MHEVLSAFHPAVRVWFERRFPHGPTDPQAAGWPKIRAGHDTLIAAPTGSGKTLSAFLVCIDELCKKLSANPNDNEPPTSVVYVSPLKALTVDIHENLERPLAEIREICRELGLPAPEIRVAVRTGDTPARERATMLKQPPHLLITTPESLYLLLTAERSREILRSTKTVIVDEIHAIARDKRGSHLALTLERLEHVALQRPVRIGLSATQRPIERIARLLVGTNRSDAQGRPDCTIVDTGHRRALELSLELPGSELEAVAAAEQVGEILDRIAAEVQSRHTTLIFVNTRRQAERFAHQLAERLGEDRVAAHHGSLSKERRLRIESRLRAGELSALVATASLELGIDVGPVELVCQIGSPRSIATFLQRVGRSGHSRFGTPVGRLYPLTRDELIECASLLRAVKAGRLDSIVFPELPLDILAQQIVAECAAEEWQEDGLYELVRRAAPFSNLSRQDFDSILELVSDGVLTGRGRRAAYLHRDRVQGRIKGRRGARLAAITSGGAIPEMADYRVIWDPGDTFIGTINEDFAIESMAGDVFLLGSTSWRIRRVERGIVRVVDAKGATPTLPFWLGEAPARTFELSEEVSELRAELDSRFSRAGMESAVEWLEAEAGISRVAAREVAQYLHAARGSLGVLPTQRDLVIERFFDETAGMQLIVHSPFGGRINRGLGLLLRKRFCTSFDFELQAAASDDAIVLSLGPQHSFALDDLRGFLRPQQIKEALINAVIVTPMFTVRWRWNLNRALIVLRFKNGKKNPPPLQRMESDDVMVAIFPALAQCQDNATGPRVIPDHPIVRQTLHDCLHEAMDLPALEELLNKIVSGEVRLHFRDTTEPSPLSHEILNSRPYTFLDDAPLEERRTRALSLRRGLPVDSKELMALDAAAIERVRAEARPEPRDADELYDVLSWLGFSRPNPDWQAHFAALVAAKRAIIAEVATGSVWCSIEKLPLFRALFPNTDLGNVGGCDTSLTIEPEAAAAHVIRGHLDTSGPVSVRQLALQTGLSAGTVTAALARLEMEGFALRGHFDQESSEEQFCARRLLSRIHAYTQERLRREIEPVSAQDFMRFLLSWQHVAPESKLEGQRGLLNIIEQLQGFEAAAGAWEAQLLKSRLENYDSQWLDTLCLSGTLSWGRLSVPAPRSEERKTSISRATPITFSTRADLPWLLQAARANLSPNEPIENGAARVLACLRERGALFFSELLQNTGLVQAQLEDALWDAVGRGLITSDGFQALRALLMPGARFGTTRPHLRRSRLRQGASGSLVSEGRWAVLPSAQSPEDSDALAEAIAEQLLLRWGVLFRDLFMEERIAIAWREIVWALRRLEARGLVRGGRFVTGFVGEQYALPEAVEMLRDLRRTERTGTLVRISGCDPLNLVGVIVPGRRVPRVRTQFVTYQDGACVASSSMSESAPSEGLIG